ncbi:hypothetical protein CBOM_04348 [Ceraceosorus bombacis]|uniref:Uncharacterized protein n=1 Tax=Ceraceosorus bombacis TaxID=401625 RepID=A0A0P1BH11_9BASI|nr:hypothetical protein CBOM_04348 [Ceraceosorus bombacis]
MPLEVRSNVHLFLLRRTWTAATSERARAAEARYQTTRHESFEDEEVLPELFGEDETDDDSDDRDLDGASPASNRRERRMQERPQTTPDADISSSQPLPADQTAAPRGPFRRVTSALNAGSSSTAHSLHGSQAPSNRSHLPFTDLYSPTVATNLANDYDSRVQGRILIGTDQARPAFSALDDDPDIIRHSTHAVDDCAHGCSVRDSTQHGYIECPVAQLVWRDALPVLYALEPALAGVPFDFNLSPTRFSKNWLDGSRFVMIDEGGHLILQEPAPWATT